MNLLLRLERLGEEEERTGRGHPVVMKAGKARVIVNPVGAADPGIAAADIRAEGLDEDAGIPRPAPDEIFEPVEMIVGSGARGQEKGEAVESAKLVETTPERKAPRRSEAASGFHRDCRERYNAP